MHVLYTSPYYKVLHKGPNAEQFYVTYAPYVSLTYPHQASVPVVPVHSSAQAAASSSELPRSLIAAQSRSQKPRGSNVRPQRHSVPRFCAMFQGHFRATSGPLQGHIVKGFDKGTSYGAACSMPSDWVTRNSLLQKEAATSRKISFFLCLMPSDRQDLNHSRHKHQLSMTWLTGIARPQVETMNLQNPKMVQSWYKKQMSATKSNILCICLSLFCGPRHCIGYCGWRSHLLNREPWTGGTLQSPPSGWCKNKQCYRTVVFFLFCFAITFTILDLSSLVCLCTLPKRF